MDIQRPKLPNRQKSEIFTARPTRKEELYLTPDDMERMQKHERRFKFGIIIKKVAVRLIITIFIAILVYGGYFLWKAHEISKKMNSDQQTKNSFIQDMRSMISPIIPDSSSPLDGENDGRINILLLGAAGEHNPGGNLTDTIMVMNIDTANKKIALLSVPRDLYVNIPETNSYTKINSLYEIGLKSGDGADLIKQSIEKITGIKINYYLAIDFDGFKQIIDDIGGVNVIAERDLFDSRYPGPNYSYETFSITKGFHSLDGATALKYVRERHSDPEGDFGRAKRQQQVIQAVKNKLFSMETFFNVARLNDVMNTLGDNIKTNVSFENIDSFIKLSKKLDTQNITNVVADAWKPDSLLKVSHVQMGNAQAFVLVPRVGNYSEIQDLAQNIFNRDELKRRSNEMAKENASINIINQSGDNTLPEKIRKLLTEKLNFKDVHMSSSSSSVTLSQSKIYDDTNRAKLFTIDELVKKLPATLASSSDQLANSSSDITIVLGKDLVDTYKYDEASLEEYNKAQDAE